MPLITSAVPKGWKHLKTLVTAILNESGMDATNQVNLDLPRGNVDVDVYAGEPLGSKAGFADFTGNRSNHGRHNLTLSCFAI